MHTSRFPHGKGVVLRPSFVYGSRHVSPTSPSVQCSPHSSRKSVPSVVPHPPTHPHPSPTPPHRSVAPSPCPSTSSASPSSSFSASRPSPRSASPSPAPRPSSPRPSRCAPWRPWRRRRRWATRGSRRGRGRGRGSCPSMTLCGWRGWCDGMGWGGGRRVRGQQQFCVGRGRGGCKRTTGGRQGAGRLATRKHKGNLRRSNKEKDWIGWLLAFLGPYLS